MKILAIDQATLTGWALTDGTYGTLKLTGSWGEKLNKFYDFVLDHAEHVHLIVYEKPTGRFHTSLVSGSKLAGIVELVGAMTSTPVASYSPGEIKKFATGKGNASKLDMVEAARRYGYLGDDDNIADALHMMKLTLHENSN